MILVDSNILIYSLNISSPKYKKARNFLQDNLDKLVIAHQNILETFRVLTHPKFPKKVSSKDVLEALDNLTKEIEVIYPGFETYYIVLELLKKHNLKGDQIFDCYLTATALSNGVEVIATDNTKDFKKFKEIKVFNPFSESH